MLQSAQFVILTPRKPLYGRPCNGCGDCCTAEACTLSRDYIHSEASPCVALEWDGTRYHCGLISHPRRHLKEELPIMKLHLPNEERIIGDMFAHMLGAGKGCDAECSIADTEEKKRLYAGRKEGPPCQTK